MMKKNISYIPMDHALEIWLLEKLFREPPESAYTKDFLMGIQDLISGEVSSLLLNASEDTELSIGSHSDELLIGDLEIYPRSRKVLIKGSEVSLTPKEFDILELLLLNKGITLSAKRIYEKVWREEFIANDKTVLTHISNLREKIEKDPEENRYIKTVWGTGYKI